MATGMTTTGDISYRTAGYFSRELLKRAQPLLCLTRLGTPKTLPKNAGKTIKFRGYLHLDNQPKALIEGVTPEASKPEYRDVECMIGQYGDYVELTDVITDTHEDPLIAEFSDILGEQSAIMIERITKGVLMGGTNVLYSGETGGVIATSRTGVNKPISLNLIRRAIRALKRQEARPLTNVITASPDFDTSPIAPSFIAVCHVDLEADLRELKGFVPVEHYSSYQPLEGEIGACEGLRFVMTTIMEPFLNAGAAPEAGDKIESEQGACADVYPILVFGKNAFGVVPFARASKGASPISPMVLNPNTPRGGDPLGQRGTIGWKAYHTAVILYDFYMLRIEVAASRL